MVGDQGERLPEEILPEMLHRLDDRQALPFTAIVILLSGVAPAEGVRDGVLHPILVDLAQDGAHPLL